MVKSYYISKNNLQMGPFSEEEIQKKILKKEILWMDYIYEDQKKDWIFVMEHPKFNKLFTESLLKASIKHNANGKKLDIKTLGQHGQKAWFVLKENNNYGPFTKMDVIQMLQAKLLFEFDFIWHSKFENWKRVAEVDDFSKEEVKKLLKSEDPKINDIFLRRRNARIDYGCSLIVHNNKQVFKGRSIEISSGGAGLFIETDQFKPGQNLFLHFQPGDGVPPFNAVCTIISKQFVSESDDNKFEFKYGVKFTSISQSVKQKIQEFAEKEKSKGKKAS